MMQRVQPRVNIIAPLCAPGGSCRGDALNEDSEIRLIFGDSRGAVHQYADAPNTIGALCTRSKRPRYGRTENRDEFAPFHMPPGNDAPFRLKRIAVCDP